MKFSQTISIYKSINIKFNNILIIIFQNYLNWILFAYIKKFTFKILNRIINKCKKDFTILKYRKYILLLKC
jgi:hypothetical protein